MNFVRRRATEKVPDENRRSPNLGFFGYGVYVILGRRSVFLEYMESFFFKCHRFFFDRYVVKRLVVTSSKTFSWSTQFLERDRGGKRFVKYFRHESI